MIPLQLRLRNFLSYGSVTQTVDFEPYRLICLTGKNGHGKSALLDAITWALWGQARKAAGITKSDELLMRLGQSHMMVALDFLCGKNRYRVTRELVFIANKKSQLELHLGLYNSEQDAYSVLTEKTIRATQEKITALLGLDFDACVNSIFLRQGQSHEFSKRSPQERKEVLASMLGLTAYDDLKGQALEHVREGNKEVAVLQHHITALQEELAREALLRERLVLVQGLLEGFEQQELKTRDHLDYREKERIQLQERYQLTRIARAQYDQHSVLLMQKERDLRALADEWRSVNRKRRTYALSKAEESVEAALEKELVEQDQARFQQSIVKEELFALSEKRHHLLQHLQEQYAAELALRNNALHVTKVQQEAVELKLRDLCLLVQKKETSYKQLILDSQACAEVFKGDQERYGNVGLELKQMERAAAFFDRWQLIRVALEKEALQLAQDREALNIPGTLCPLCVQELSSEHRAVLEDKLERHMRRIAHRKSRLERVLDAVSKKLKNHGALVHEAKKIFATITQCEQQLQVYTARILELENEQALMAKERQALEGLVSEGGIRLDLAQRAFSEWSEKRETFLSAQPEFLELEKRRLDLQIKLAAILYDAQKEAILKAKLFDFRQKNAEAQTFLSDLTKQGGRVQGIHEICIELKRLKKENKDLWGRMQGAAELEKLVLENEEGVKNCQKELTRIAHERGPLLQEKGALDQQLLSLGQKTLVYKERLVKKARFEQLLEDYQLLATALGKNGIQALLIENTIPEIEYEANALLGKLTDNQAHVMFESVRDLKGGGTKETLDIKISESRGIRPYELFSGGEAFRIDFALRIAISKLLARRSGTSLQTLIIDEGFGSQDEEGLAHLMEALYDIQDDFEKIIVVSHLPSMKSQFPTNFFVQKETDGSMITVLEQG